MLCVPGGGGDMSTTGTSAITNWEFVLNRDNRDRKPNVHYFLMLFNSLLPVLGPVGWLNELLSAFQLLKYFQQWPFFWSMRFVHVPYSICLSESGPCSCFKRLLHFLIKIVWNYTFQIFLASLSHELSCFCLQILSCSSSLDRPSGCFATLSRTAACTVASELFHFAQPLGRTEDNRWVFSAVHEKWLGGPFSLIRYSFI